MNIFINWLAPILSTLIICAGQLMLNARFKRADEKRDAAHAETQAKRSEEAQWRKSVDKLLSEQSSTLSNVAQDRIDWYAWRDEVERRMNEFEAKLAEMNDKTDATLRGQLTQMRSDTVHKAHRYLDDLGCASTDEKQAFDAEYKEYAELCDAYGIENEFVENLHKQVMALPGRDM